MARRGDERRRISRPSSVRIGMFCRFGSELLRRPVAATAWLKQVCTRPSSGGPSAAARRCRCSSACAAPRQSSTSRGISWLSASSSSTSAAVEADRVLPVFFAAGSCSFSNRILPSCCGELTLNSSPASSKMRAVVAAPAPARCGATARPAPRPSMRMPARSIVDEHRHERHLELAVDRVESIGDEQRRQPRRPAAARGRRARRHKSSSGRRRQARERRRLGAAAADVLLGQRLVAEVLERRLFERMPGARRVEQVAGEHRVERDAAQRDAVPRQHHDVELEVVTDLADRLVLEQRPQPVERRRRASTCVGLACALESRSSAAPSPFVAERHVARLPVGASRRRCRRCARASRAAGRGMTRSANSPAARSSAISASSSARRGDQRVVLLDRCRRSARSR